MRLPIEIIRHICRKFFLELFDDFFSGFISVISEQILRACRLVSVDDIRTIFHIKKLTAGWLFEWIEHSARVFFFAVFYAVEQLLLMLGSSVFVYTRFQRMKYFQ